MASTETQTTRRQLAQVAPRPRFAFLDALADLERQSPPRLFPAPRELRPVIQLPHPEVGNASGWSLVNDSSPTVEPRRGGKLSPETRALREWIESDDLDWDAIERARDEAWGD